MLEWNSKNGNWHVVVTKENWKVFFKNELVTEQGRLFASRNVPQLVRDKTNELIEQVEQIKQ